MPDIAHTVTYTADLKEALTGRRDARFVWLCNFEVETAWARGRAGLPLPRASAAGPMVRRMEQLGALLAEPSDVLLLGDGLDPDFRRYAERTGLGVPTELVTDPGTPGEGTADAVLSSPRVLGALRELAAQGAYLMPMGASAVEQKILETTGLRSAVAHADVFERVNSKIYSRRAAAELGLRTIPGHTCESVAELREVLTRSDPGTRPLIVKDAYGVSGKGLLVLDSAAKAQRLLRMVEARARRTGSDALDVVVEHYLPKAADLAYQFVVDRVGRVRLDFVKEALITDGVPAGNVTPAALSGRQHAELAEAAERLGGRLHRDGFFGVVGVDALLGADGLLYPVLEINARLSMGSYQGRVVERFLPPGGSALARHYPLTLGRRIPFADIDAALASAGDPAGGSGAVVTCFGTVNAAAGAATPFRGRLYTVLHAADRASLTELDHRVTAALGRVAGVEGTS
ncbi:ATP-grasp domain-containing protein [Streptomyces sp. NPDC053048]|uniref:preATP grasp domain-containing protein n=1 Tax=Streptomyces sp. NPDC053048 TaxID=3365694 RepID=UPI0037D5FC58